MNDYFDDVAINIDTDCLSSDFDSYDLYGERLEESDDNYGNNIQFE